MNTRSLMILTAVTITYGVAVAQTRRAAMIGGGNPDWGRCAAEIVVDGAAAVEIRGDAATLRDVSGQAPQWRRFECTSPMPPNPGDVRFSVSRGRGRAEMIRDPRNGGVAVVRIEDPEGGSDVYAFELVWNNHGARPEPPPPVDRREGRVEDLAGRVILASIRTKPFTFARMLSVVRLTNAFAGGPLNSVPHTSMTSRVVENG